MEQGVDGFAQGIAAGPNGRGVGEGIDDFGFLESKSGGGGGSPHGTVGKTGHVADVDIADALQGGGDGVAQRRENSRKDFLKLAPDAGFRARRGDVREVDGYGPVGQSARRVPSPLSFVLRRNQYD